MRIGFGGRTAIGLDVGLRSIGAVQLVRAGGDWSVEAATMIARQGSESSGPGGSGDLVPSIGELRQLAEVLYRQGFTGNRVNLVAPESAVFSTTLELPPRSSGAPIEELARQELARTAKRDGSAIEVGMWDVPSPPRAGGAELTHVLAVGLAHKDSEQLVDVFEAAGLVVEAVDCRCCAMVRGCAAVVGDGAQVSAIVDLTESSLSIAVVHSGVVAYDRPVREVGLWRVREQVRTELRVEGEAADYLIETLARGEGDGGLPEHTLGTATRLMDEYLEMVVQELRSVMAYAIHRYPGSIGPVVLTGAGAGLQGLHRRIREDLDLEVRTVSLADVVRAGIAPELEQVCRDAALTVAAGLAMHPGAAKASRRAA